LIAHLQAAEAAPGVRRQVIGFLCDEPGLLNTWFDICGQVLLLYTPKLEERRLRKSKLVLLCEMGLISLLQDLNAPHERTEAELAMGLRLVVTAGHVEAVRSLLGLITSEGPIEQQLMRATRMRIFDPVFPVLLEHALQHRKHILHNASTYLSSLNAACRQGHIHSVKSLLDFRAQSGALRENLSRVPRIQRSYFHSSEPLRAAAAIGHIRILEELLSTTLYRSMINPPSAQHEYTPLHASAQNGHLNIVKMLVNTTGRDRANVGLRDPLTRRTALHLACMTGYPRVVSYLLPIKASSSRGQLNNSWAFMDKDRRTVMHHAAGQGGSGVVSVLFETEAGITCEAMLDESYMRPLHLAAQADDAESIKILLKSSSQQFYKEHGGAEGMTPLHLATVAASVASVRSLISNGPAVGIVNDADDAGYTPLHAALSGGIEASINLDYKRERKFLEIAEILITLRRGADVLLATPDGFR